MIQLTKDISYIPSRDFPLSSDVAFIKTEDGYWIYDTGSSTEALTTINDIKESKSIVISHFHPDHTFNLKKCSYDNLYVSGNTQKYTKTGTIVTSPLTYGPVTIMPIPSSHCKGSLILVYKDYAFLGDATYRKIKFNAKCYNAQLLLEEIKLLESLEVKYFCISHNRKFVRDKEAIINLLKEYYSYRKGNDSEIYID